MDSIEHDLYLLDQKKAREEREEKARLKGIELAAVEKEKYRQKVIAKRKDAFLNVAIPVGIFLLIVGVIAGVSIGIDKYFDKQDAKQDVRYAAWAQTCNDAAGDPVGEDSNQICVFPNAELPYGKAGRYTYYEEDGKVWIDNCNRAGGRVVGVESKSICYFPSGAELEYGVFD